MSFQGKRLRLPAQTCRRHFLESRVQAHRYPDGRMAVFRGPGKLAESQPDGSLVEDAGDEERTRVGTAR